MEPDDGLSTAPADFSPAIVEGLPVALKCAPPAAPVWRLRDVLWALAIPVLYVGLAFIGRSYLIDQPLVLYGYGILLLALAELALLAYPLWLCRRRGVRMPIPRPPRRKLLIEGGIAVLAGFGILFGAGALYYAFQFLFPGVRPVVSIWQQAASSSRAVFLIPLIPLAMFFAPVCEETFFRWFLQGALRKYMPAFAAGLIQCLAFGLIHLSDGGYGIFPFLYGIGLTLLYAWRKTLLAPIAAHFFINTYATMALVVLAVITAGTPMLGVGCEDHPQGVLVVEVFPGSAAEEADIRKGDVITEFSGTPVRSALELTGYVRMLDAEDRVPVRLLRNGDILDKEVVLKVRPPG